MWGLVRCLWTLSSWASCLRLALPLSPARPRESSAEGALFDRAQSHCERFRRVQSSNTLRSLRNAFACASPRPARCGASWPFARACPADSPNIPSAAAKSCAAARRAATAARALVPRLERHESGAAGLRAERPPSAQPRIASMPTALPRRPKQARAMLTPFMLLTLVRPPAPSQIQNNVDEAGVPRCPWCWASS